MVVSFNKQTNINIFLKKMQQLNTKKRLQNKRAWEKSIGIKWLSERIVIFSDSYLYESPLCGPTF